MSPVLAAVLFALFLWWFSTGVILAAVSRAGRGAGGYRRAVLLALPVFLAALAALHFTPDERSPAAAYLGFTAAIGLWGWIELAFLAGIITGPNRRPCPPGLPEWERFLRAWGTIAHHEIALILGFCTIILLDWGQQNQIAFWTFVVLYVARISAKLNVFLGVPNINVEFLPAPVRHLSSYFRKRAMNWVFPVAVTGLTFATACWIERAHFAPAGSGREVEFTLLATLTALALLEHWLMILPLPDAALWRWMMPDNSKGHRLHHHPATSEPILPAGGKP